MEGRRLVEDALAAGVEPTFCVIADHLVETAQATGLEDRLLDQNVPVLKVDDGLFATLTDVDTPQGLLAVVPIPDLEPPAACSLTLVADAVRDPGNLGTMLRTSVAAGVESVLTAPGTVDVTNPKVVRGAMGAHFRIPITRVDWDHVGEQLRGAQVWVADAAGEVDYLDVDWREPAAIVVSSEAHGASDAALALGRTMRITMPGPAESLNAATAAAVVLFEVVRQRREPS